MSKILIAILLMFAVITQATAAVIAPTNKKQPAAVTTTAPTAAPTPRVNSFPPAIPSEFVMDAPKLASTTPKPVTATPAETHSKLYAGAQLGDSTIGALLGYQISPMYAMEISGDYVDPIYTPTTVLKRYRMGASGLAMFPLKFDAMGAMALYVKVGYEYASEKYTVNNPGFPVPPATSVTTTTHKTGVTGSAGIQVDLSERATARLGVNVIGTDRSVYLNALRKF